MTAPGKTLEPVTHPAPAAPTDEARGVGRVDFGALRRSAPFNRTFGMDRGLAIDRYYIERFISTHAADVRGRVLEVAEDTYARKYGRRRVTRCDILHVDPEYARATITADLTVDGALPVGAFDCIILTQTLPFIYDVRSAVRNLYAGLRRGGVLLATFAGISPISRYDMDRWGDYWRLTTRSARRVFEEAFHPEAIDVAAEGSVLTAAAFLYGLCAGDLRRAELDHHDPDFEVIITVRAVKYATAP